MTTNKVYCSIAETAAKTGLSTYFLRKNVKENRIPCIRSGAKVLINTEKLSEYLDAMASGGAFDGDGGK